MYIRCHPTEIYIHAEKKMRIIFRIAFVVSLLFSCGAVTALPQESLIREIEFAPFIVMPEELLHRFTAGEGTYLLVDIRPADRFAAGRIRGAVHFEWPHGGSAAPDSSGRSLHLEEPLDGILPPDIDILLIDEAGKNSFELLRFLLQRGYSRVWVVEGGMQNWPYGEYIETGAR